MPKPFSSKGEQVIHVMATVWYSQAMGAQVNLCKLVIAQVQSIYVMEESCFLPSIPFLSTVIK